MAVVEVRESIEAPTIRVRAAELILQPSLPRGEFKRGIHDLLPRPFERPVFLELGCLDRSRPHALRASRQGQQQKREETGGHPSA